MSRFHKANMMNHLNKSLVYFSFLFILVETFNVLQEIVQGGKYLPKGMPNFGDRLSEQDVADVKQYILSVATRKRTEKKVE